MLLAKGGKWELSTGKWSGRSEPKLGRVHHSHVEARWAAATVASGEQLREV